MKTPRIPYEHFYTIILATIMELAIIPIAFGALTSIVLSRGQKTFGYVVTNLKYS
jgi:hypothetical protein